MTTIPDKYLDLLQQKKAFASLATVMSDGSPQVSQFGSTMRMVSFG
jgi:hypothetical protein